MEREAAPIRRIHVSDRGRFGTARIDAAEQGLEALGYVVPNRVIGAALWAGLARASTVTVIAPARVTGSELDGATRAVTYEHAGQTHTLAARLVVAADGIRSLVRDQAGIDAEHLAYEQVALTAVMTTQRFHDHVAYERFTEEGPIAILPLTDGRCGMVWTRRPDAVERLLALSDAEFLAEFQAAFGFRLGRFLRVGQRAAYPLSLSRAERHTAQRLAVVGNAAQGLHPIAGQGFNLGLRDAMSLAEVIADAFPGARLTVTENSGYFELLIHQHGLLRPLSTAELSDGTLRFLLLTAALLSPRPPKLMILNEPETSLHADLLPAQFESALRSIAP
jgi:2-octaprenyl-6-methoxyphenol hydroxylase